jgi:hypothetical protein
MSQTVQVSAALLSAAANVLEAISTEHASALAADLRAAAGEATTTTTGTTTDLATLFATATA